jgi:hypothetical protein
MITIHVEELDDDYLLQKLVPSRHGFTFDATGCSGWRQTTSILFLIGSITKVA